jgi:hypothetical protein|uniref:Uncharacterized protein n=1 Tax=viral metagenome TaxID=1070528 RepID=A0A6H1ZBC6_9ZZZZ
MTEPDEMLRWIARRMESLKIWLRDHGRSAKRPRPESEIEMKEYDLARFEEIRAAYVKAWERKKAAA